MWLGKKVHLLTFDDVGVNVIVIVGDDADSSLDIDPFWLKKCNWRRFFSFSKLAPPGFSLAAAFRSCSHDGKSGE